MTCAEDHDSSCVSQNGIVLWITYVIQYNRFNGQTGLIQALGEDHVAGPVLVLHPPMTGLARDEYYLGLVFTACLFFFGERNYAHLDLMPVGPFVTPSSRVVLKFQLNLFSAIGRKVHLMGKPLVGGGLGGNFRL